MEILIALAVVASVALLAGVLLAVISHFFGVEKSHELKAISACLPGVNCGACGFKGCDDYAAALAKGAAAPNRCIPGGENTARALSDLLGIEIERPKDVVAFVHWPPAKRITWECLSAAPPLWCTAARRAAVSAASASVSAPRCVRLTPFALRMALHTWIRPAVSDADFARISAPRRLFRWCPAPHRLPCSATARIRVPMRAALAQTPASAARSA